MNCYNKLTKSVFKIWNPSLPNIELHMSVSFKLKNPHVPSIKSCHISNCRNKLSCFSYCLEGRQKQTEVDANTSKPQWNCLIPRNNNVQTTYFDATNRK